MARASTRTILSLDRFAQIVGIHPLHFNQVIIDDIPTCDDEILQHPWQSAGRISREDIALAIATAEDKISAELGYDWNPRWNTDELMRVNSWSWTGKASKGMLIGGGVETLSLIQADAAIVRSSIFGGGYQETCTVSVATSVTDPDEIAVFYPASVLSTFGYSAGDYAWQIRPISVSISGGTATIKFRRELIVRPQYLEDWDTESVPGTDNAYFLTTVDIYRHYNDPSSQVEFRYRAECCCDSGCAQCVYSTQTGCLIPTYARMGHVSLTASEWDGNAHVFDIDPMSICGSFPEGALLQYKAGYLGPDSGQFERIVAHLALAELGQSLCSCSGIENKFDYYTTDLVSGVSPVGGADSKQRVYKDPSPLGSSRAAFEAWEYIKNRALGRGSLNG